MTTNKINFVFFVLFALVTSNPQTTDYCTHASVAETAILEEKIFQDNNFLDDRYYPRYHVRPPSMWMNDPNGPIQHPDTKMYHLYFQYNPASVGFGNMEWAHANSSDLVFWQYQGVALKSGEPYDRDGCWSGSASVINGKVLFMYTGVVGTGDNVVERQAVALPLDATMNQLSRPSFNPVIEAPPQNVPATLWRDPTSVWFEKSCNCYKLLIGASLYNKAGASLIYSTPSANLDHFKLSGYFYQNETWGYMFECPDHFTLTDPVTHEEKTIFKASLLPDRVDVMAIGTTNTKGQFELESDKVLVDAGKIAYATKSFYDDSNQRRILWSWIPETDPEQEYQKRDWAGIQSLPRVVKLENNALKIIPIPELKKLRGHNTSFNNIDVMPGYPWKLQDTSISSKLQFELLLNFTIDPTSRQEFGAWIFWSGNGMKTRVFCNATNEKFEIGVDLLFSGSTGKREVLVTEITPSSQVSMHIFVDHSILEVFSQDGEARITTRVYPPSDTEAYFIGLFSSFQPVSTTFALWDLNSIWRKA